MNGTESESHDLKPESSQISDSQVNDELEQNENDQTALIHLESSSSSRAKWYRILVTILICCGEFAHGVTFNCLVAVALTDLTHMVNSSVDKTAIIFTFQNVGYILGTLFGFFYNYLNRHLMLILMQLVIGITIAVTPQSCSLIVLFTLLTVNGVACGGWDCGQTVWLIQMWKEKSASILQSSLLFYALGSTTAPLLAKPFISNNNSSVILNQTDIDSIRNHLQIPFGISGLLSIIVGSLLILLFTINHWKDSQTDQIHSEITGRPNLSQTETKVVIFLGGIMLATYECVEMLGFSFLPIFAQNTHLKVSPQDSALMLFALSLAYSIGRAISVFTTMKFKPKYILTIQFYLLFNGHNIMILGGNNNLIALWIGSISLGFGYSATLPAIYSLLERTIEINNFRGTILIFMSATLSIASPFLIGHTIEQYPLFLFIFSGLNILISVIMFISILTIIHNR